MYNWKNGNRPMTEAEKRAVAMFSKEIEQEARRKFSLYLHEVRWIDRIAYSAIFVGGIAIGIAIGRHL